MCEELSYLRGLTETPEGVIDGGQVGLQQER